MCKTHSRKPDGAEQPRLTPHLTMGIATLNVWPSKMEDRVVGRMIQGDMHFVVPDEATHKYS
jgi:hypothetical protein